MWVMVISKMKMSVAYPIATALNLALVVLGSAWLLKEL
jgi:multidrug transporter EmrE-like cation transporter